MINKSTGDSKQAQSNDEALSIPLIVNDANCINPNYISHDKDECQIQSPKNNAPSEKGWMIIWTGIIAISGLVAIGVGFLQWSAMSDQRKLMDDQRRIMSDQSRVMSDQLIEMKGLHHWAGACFKRLKTGAIANCANNNEVH